MRTPVIGASRFRPLLVQALLLPLLAMVAFAGVLLWQVTRVLDNQHWVDHTDQVIAKANELHAIHLRAESALRGYLVTQEPYFRELFDAETSSMTSHSQELAAMVSDNPPQVERVLAIRQVRQKWVEIAEREFALRDSNGDWAAVVKAGVARSTMHAMDEAFQQFVGIEQTLRNQRTATVQAAFIHTVWLAIALAAAIGIALAMLSRRHLSYLSSTYGRALREANDAANVLEHRVAERTAELAAANESMKLAAQALRITNERLRISNRELQDFASVASHDLQEPLRKVQAFGDRLRLKSASVLGPESADYLDRMLSAAERMKTLINDLLTFARVTSRAQPFQPVDLHLVTQQVLSDLETRIEQTLAIVEVAELPTIDADVTQMRQLMQNLVGNALKFSKPGERPHVEVKVKTNVVAGEPWVELHVQDHGIGFDEKYLDRIFTVFQRLHGRAEYEGTGIGLAVCRKIVERHRGTLTARSQVGAGSTFIVSLPMKQPVIDPVVELPVAEATDRVPGFESGISVPPA